MMKLAELVACSGRVAGTRSRNAKTEQLAACVAQLGADEVAIGVGYLSGEMRQGRIGLGYAAVYKTELPAAASEATLTLGEVDAALTRIQQVSGKGSGNERTRLYGQLMARATGAEQQFLRQLLVGELRQGALAGLLVDAIAKAAEVDAALVRRAAMLSGDLGAVARAALYEGRAALAAFRLQLFRPIEPMLAQVCDDPDEAMQRLEEAVLDFKLDGARIQVHKRGDDVAVYTRNLREVTPAVPEVVERVRQIDAGELVLDGEVIAMQPDGTPHPFQTTMRRFGRKLDVARLRQELPLSGYFFDVLQVDGETLIDAPTRLRLERLSQLVPAESVMPRLITADAAAAEAFLDDALRLGHEGIMAKSPSAPYAAGSRGADWLKIKPAHTLDLVVLAAEWGSGRRQGWLSNIHLGARNPDGSFTMLGKTFKGMTDETLRWQTETFQQLAIGSEGHVVHIRPEIVVEIAFADIQASPRYPGGYALRLARVKRYRPDKRAAEADTIATIEEIYRGSAAAKRRAKR